MTPRVIDLTARVKTRNKARKVQIEEALNRLFDDLLGLCTDNDGAMAQGTDKPFELMHQDFWQGALVEMAGEALAKHLPRSELNEAIDRVTAKLHRHLEHCFSHGGQVVGGSFDILKAASALPAGVKDAEDLDQHASAYRVPLIKDAIRMGHVKLMTATVPLFTYLRRQRGVRIGMYTNSDRLTGSTICQELFGKELFDELIRETPDKPRRLYGSDVPRSKRKPHSYGWGVLANNMGLKPEDCAIMEDRLNVIEQALTDFPFRFAILVMAPENHRHNAEYEEKLKATLSRLREWRGAPIIVVRNLARLQVLLTGKKQ